MSSDGEWGLSWERCNRAVKWPNDRVPTEADWIRLAAFVDGEGCVRVELVSTKWRAKAVNPRHNVIVVMGNCDPRLAEWCFRTFGGRVFARQKQDARWRRCYAWHASSNLAKAVLRGMYPHLLLKREQADIALAIAATFGTLKKGQRLPPELVDRRIKLATQLSDLKRQVIEPTELDNIKVFPDRATSTKRKEIGA